MEEEEEEGGEEEEEEEQQPERSHLARSRGDGFVCFWRGRGASGAAVTGERSAAPVRRRGELPSRTRVNFAAVPPNEVSAV